MENLEKDYNILHKLNTPKEIKLKRSDLFEGKKKEKTKKKKKVVKKYKKK